MREVELVLVWESDKCTMYTIQFLSEDKNEFQRFIAKFKDDATYNPDFVKIVNFISQISERGALERYFRPEGKMKDGVCALPTISSNSVSTVFVFQIVFSYSATAVSRIPRHMMKTIRSKAMSLTSKSLRNC